MQPLQRGSNDNIHPVHFDATRRLRQGNKSSAMTGSFTHSSITDKNVLTVLLFFVLPISLL